MQLYRGKDIDYSTINTHKVNNDMQRCRGSSVNNSKGNKILSLSSREVHSGDIIEESSNDNDNMNSVNVPDVRGEEARSEDVGSEDVGSEDVGIEDVGSEDVGSEVIEESNGNMMTCTGSMKRKLPKMKTHVEFLPQHTKGEEVVEVAKQLVNMLIH